MHCFLKLAWVVFMGVACAPNSPTDMPVVPQTSVEAERVDALEPSNPPTPDPSATDPESEPELPAEAAAEPATVAELAMNPGVPLPDSIRESLEKIEFDPFPEALVLDAHYWVSNENNHQLYKPSVDNHRGIYLGVGTDQNYLIAAWSRSPILLMMDFDEQIRNVHDIYGSIFRRVEDPKTFVQMWSEPRADEVVTWLREDFEGKRLADLEVSFKRARKPVFGRLRKVVKDYKEREIKTFLSDDDQYTFIRNLWLNKRVFSYRGDLTANLTMVQIAQVLKSHRLNLGLVYLSNAEQYFEFTPEYRRNMIVQPFDERSLILRTRPWEELGYPEGGRYHYNVQSAQNFATWLRVNNVKNASRLLAGYRTNHKEVLGLSEIKREPRPSKTPPVVAPMP